MKKQSKSIEAQKKEALDISIKEGAAAHISTSTGTSYITPFALAMNASPLQIGFLSSFAGLLNPVAQMFGSKMMEETSRKKLVIKTVLYQALMWIPIAILGLLFWQGIFQQHLVTVLIVLYSLFIIFGGLHTPSWYSWMGDLIPDKKRGRYFAKRNKIAGTAGLIAALIAGLVLDAFKTKGLIFIGFAILFASSFTFRLISHVKLKKQYSPDFKLKKGYYFSFWNFIKTYDNFGKFAVFRATFNFALMIASPFFAVYMLNVLGFSYTTFIIVSLSASIDLDCFFMVTSFS